MTKPRFVVEQHIILPGDSPTRVVIRISEPVQAVDRDGDSVWECHLRLDGLYEKLNPARGLTSFDAMMHALLGAYQLVRDVVGTKGKVIFLNPRTPDPPGPDDYVTLKELFQLGGFK